MEQYDCDVAVVGAGLVGAGFACALAGTGLRIAVVDAALPPAADAAWDARIYAISPGSVGFLGACNAWARIDPERVCAVTGMEVHGDDARSRIAFDAYRSGVQIGRAHV